MNKSVEIGLSKDDRTSVVEALSKVLADAYALYLKTHGYHWNVRGQNFHSLHSLFEEQYREQWSALDNYAERIRALGELAPQGYGAFANLSAIQDGDPTRASNAMVEDLLESNQTLLTNIRSAFSVAEEAKDEATIDLLNARRASHEKAAWMLRATLGEI